MNLIGQMSKPPSEDPEKRAIVKACMFSYPLFGTTFFPSRFHRPNSPKIQGKIYAGLARPSQQKCFASNRNSGKTSIVDLNLPAHDIVYQKRHLIVMIGANFDMMVVQTENLKRELTTNPKLLDLFGSIRSESRDEVFAKKMWVASSPTGIDTMVVPRGASQPVRGLIYKDYRPDLIIVDDLEDPENMDSDEQRQKKLEWFFSDVMCSFDRSSKDWQVVVIGTVLHEDSLVAKLLEYDDWDTEQLELCDDEDRSNWPEYISDEEVHNLRLSYEDKGLEDVFAREFRNIPISPQKRAFKKEMFQYYVETDRRLWERRDVENLVLADPAKTVKMSSADSAVVGVGFDMADGNIYVRDITRGKLHPEEFYAAIVEMARRLGTRLIGLEVTGLEDYILYPFKSYCSNHGFFPDIIELHAKTKKGSKEKRVAGLIPFYRGGKVFHNQHCPGITVLENQLKWFPKSKLWDVMDALAYFVEVLEEGERYAPFLYSEIEPESNYADLEAEYAMEEAIPDDWQDYPY